MGAWAGRFPGPTLLPAHGNAGGEGAPTSGTLKKISLIAGEAGSFQLQLAKVKADGNENRIRIRPKAQVARQTRPTGRPGGLVVQEPGSISREDRPWRQRGHPPDPFTR